ncbi:MAG: hypothetical protein ABJM26_05225 [Anderseniella sp.]
MLRSLSAIRCLITVGAVCLTQLPSAAADEKGEISFHLNSAAGVKDACRFNFVFRNGVSRPIKDLVLELVVFNDEDLVDRFVLVKSGSLPKGKTRVRQFDFSGLACDKVSKLLVNEVKVCEGDGLEPEVCLSRLETKGSKSIRLLK